MIESSLFLAIASDNPTAIKAAIDANLEFMTAEQVEDFYQGHLAALGGTGLRSKLKTYIKGVLLRWG